MYKHLLAFLLSITFFSIQAGTYKDLEEAKKNPSDVTELDFSFSDQIFIPDAIYEFPNLESIILRWNRNLNLDNTFHKLSKVATLKSIDLSWCYFSEIPQAIKEVKQIEHLRLSNNKLFKIHENIQYLH